MPDIGRQPQSPSVPEVAERSPRKQHAALPRLDHPDRGGARRRLGRRDPDPERGAEDHHRLQVGRGTRGRQDQDPLQRRRHRHVTTIRLSDDHQHVITTAQMAPKTEDFLVEDTQFWVVRPRISGANVTGLGTLISGAYIGMEIGQSKESKRDFVALETPPVVTGDVPGRFFMLKTPNLGSLDNGTPIFFRRLQVGQVASYELDKDGKFSDHQGVRAARPTTSTSTRTRASGTPAGSTCRSPPAASACRPSRCCRS